MAEKLTPQGLVVGLILDETMPNVEDKDTSKLKSERGNRRRNGSKPDEDAESAKNDSEG